ncbi:MAG: hypothetical protein ABJG15_08310 [Hyphomonadaceae bacterium]
MTQVIVRGINFFTAFTPIEPLKPIILIEGLFGSGKSYLARQFKHQGSRTILLDDFLPDQFGELSRWISSVVDGGCATEIRSAISSSDSVVVEGAAAVPVIEKVLPSLDEDRVTKIYVKQMSNSGGVISWIEGEMLHADLPEAAQLSDVRSYHRDQKPWTTANIIFERLPPENTE